jgi:oxygen-independent coproporphyrinogen-3 oxidase
MQDDTRCGPVSLYLHFPFCVRKCRYCDFLSGPAAAKEREEYIQTLCLEIELRAAEVPAGVDTVFIGGGTPSLMTPDQAERVMAAIRRSYVLADDAEISMEVNPGTADADKLCAFRKVGINRLSIGVQSFDDGELKLLGRIHTADQAREIMSAAREAGFQNINLDLMSALPGQSVLSWERSLQEAVRQAPEHISAYSLIIEEGTPFAAMALPALPSEEEDREMYHFTKHFLASNGYRRYEISNYAREGFECRHNCGYWTGHDYLGLGLGASSCLGGERFRNPDRMEEYREAVKRICDDRSDPPAFSAMRCGREILTSKDRMEEFMFLGLRMTDGVSEKEFERRFGVPLQEVFADVLKRHLDQNVICRIPVSRQGDAAGTGDMAGSRAAAGIGEASDLRIALTEYGMDVANYVMADYLL